MSSTTTTTTPATTPPSTPGSSFFCDGAPALLSAFAPVAAAPSAPVLDDDDDDAARQDVSAPARTEKTGDVASAVVSLPLSSAAVATTTYVPAGTSTTGQDTLPAPARAGASVRVTSGGRGVEEGPEPEGGKEARSLVIVSVSVVLTSALELEGSDHWRVVSEQVVAFPGWRNWIAVEDVEGGAEEVEDGEADADEDGVAPVDVVLSSSSSEELESSLPRRA